MQLELVKDAKRYLVEVTHIGDRKSKCEIFTNKKRSAKREYLNFNQKLGSLGSLPPYKQLIKRNEILRLEQDTEKAYSKYVSYLRSSKRLCETSAKSMFDPVQKTQPPLDELFITVKGHFYTAIGVLIAVILLPYLFSFTAYYLIAPIAQKRFSQKLFPNSNGTINLIHPPEINLQLNLMTGEELYIKPELLKNSPENASIESKAFLSNRYPLSCIASGMYGLTKVAVTEAENVMLTSGEYKGIVSKISMIEIPNGTSIILQPRTLVGVIQSADRPIKITRHWRLFSLSSWMTFQLRYLVFHGPCQLILRGNGGINLVDVSDDKGVITDSVKGFSGNLNYSVARSPTFYAFLTNKQKLFKCRFDQASGVVIQESLDDGTGGAFGNSGNTLKRLSEAILKALGL